MLNSSVNVHLDSSLPHGGKTPDLSQEIPYVWHASFDSEDNGRVPGFTAPNSIYTDRNAQTEIAVSDCGDFDLLRDLPLLSPEGEEFLFRKMNLLLHRAERLRSSLSLEAVPSKASLNRLAGYLEDADTVRNHIAECNLRLVISIARKFSTSACDFDELMSEGNEILLKAIGKFDISRGYRFSTYATHSVQRHFYRYIQRHRKRNRLEFCSSVEVLNELPEAAADAVIDEWVREEQRMTLLISRMAERLDEREQRIVRARFGLDGQGITKTLRELSSELGLSKERVRQLQMAAVEKLRDLFDDLEREPASA
ncbi:MAG: sigma-70 family RNA polymerase sigma factor [Planctomycetaceae bacterium]